MGYKELFLATLQPFAKLTKPIKKTYKRTIKVVTNPELLEKQNAFIFSVLQPKETKVKEERKLIRERIKKLEKEPASKERDGKLKELRKILKNI